MNDHAAGPFWPNLFQAAFGLYMVTPNIRQAKGIRSNFLKPIQEGLSGIIKEYIVKAISYSEYIKYCNYNR